MASQNFRLDELGWLGFEQLCQTLLKVSLGLGIEACSGSGDWGRDAFFRGRLNFPSTRASNGPFVFQCKFTAGANAAGSKPYPAVLKAVRSEASRIREHLEKGHWQRAPKHYILMTNAHLSSERRGEITTIISEVIPDAQVHIQTGNDLCLWLNSSRDVLRAFPQLLSVTDIDLLLGRIINKATYERSEEALNYAKRKAKIFVETRAYAKAIEKLQDIGFVVLEGPPEMGKTTIGRVIALSQVLNDWDAYECRTPKEVLDCYDPTRQQVFVADDFFGRTEYEPQRVSDWQSELSHIIPKLGKKHWLILTCRAHLLKMGKAKLDVAEYSDKFPNIGEVTVNAGDLTELEKGKILYRHAKFSQLTQTTRNDIKKSALSLVKNSHFTPERIRRLTESLHQSPPDSENARIEMTQALRRPTEQMEKTFETLNPKYRWALFSLLTNEGDTSAHDSYQQVCPEKYELAPNEAFRPLSEAFITPNGEKMEWIHPSCRDLAIKILATRPDERRHFLETCSKAGLKLACSVGGGEDGSLHLPLLMDSRDWKIFALRAHKEVANDATFFAILSIALQELIKIAKNDVRIALFSNMLSELRSLIPEAIQNLDIDKLPALSVFLEHHREYGNPKSFEPQWQYCLERAEIWNESYSHLSDDLYDLEIILYFLQSVEPLEKDRESFSRKVTEICALIGKRAKSDFESFQEDIESEEDATNRESSSAEIASHLSRFSQVIGVQDDIRESLEELATDYEGLTFKFEEPEDDSSSDNYWIYQGEENVSIDKLFCDL